MSPLAARAEALAADLRHVLRKHRARIVWREELAGRTTVSVVIEDAPEGLVKALCPYHWRVALWFSLAAVLGYVTAMIFNALNKL